MKKQHLLSLILVLLTVLTSCSKKELPKVKDKSILVNYSQVTQKQVKEIIEVTGTLLPYEEYIISNENDGKVKKINFDLGDKVEKGSILAQIDPVIYDYQHMESQARLNASIKLLEGLDTNLKNINEHTLVKQAKTNMDDAYLKMQRMQALANQKLIPLQDLDTAKAKYEALKANYENTKISVQKMKDDMLALTAQNKLSAKKLSDTLVKSPITGYVQEKKVALGEYLKLNTPMFIIVQTKPLKVSASIPEKYALSIKKGHKITFKVESDLSKSFIATINRISPSVNEKTRTFTIEAICNNNDNLLKPGLFAKMQIDTGKTRNSILVPESAVYSTVGLNKVFTLQGNKVKEHLVQVGKDIDNKKEIFNNIKPTDKVVITGLDQLTDGMQVRLAREDKAYKQ